jgi:ABC-type bacteriocin/lantibiotic exporter with double-glycine peptidase domain
MDLAAGELRLDNFSLPHLDVADVRRNVGFMTQNARLFYGTLRENITLGMPRATDEEIFEALELTGAAGFVQKLPKGWTTRSWKTAWGSPAGSASRFCWRECCCAIRISC